MSATLRVSDFVDNAKLFPKPPPVISVDARQFPVTVHFNRRTVLGDYIGEAFKKVCKIHQRLPQGGVLVFLTGQQEIEVLCRKLRAAFPPHMQRKKRQAYPIKGEADNTDEVQGKEGMAGPTENNAREESGGEKMEKERKDDQDEEQTEKKDMEMDEEKRAETHEPAQKEQEPEEDESVGPLWVLPLYSALPTKQQLQVFEPPPAVSYPYTSVICISLKDLQCRFKGYRLVVVATNVAETSLTIPGIKYVVDTGRTKEVHSLCTPLPFQAMNLTRHPPESVRTFVRYVIIRRAVGIAGFCQPGNVCRQIDNSCPFLVTYYVPVQRSGRAGRTGPGHCYRLFSSAVFSDQFPQFSDPEISRIPIEGILVCSSGGVDISLIWDPLFVRGCATDEVHGNR